jgi:FAD/FMN-containing dehydrogenase
VTGIGDGWDGAVVVWNGVGASVRPLVVQPSSAGDIAAAVAFARDHGLLLEITGMSSESEAPCIGERCLTLDLSRMQDVYVSYCPPVTRLDRPARKGG